MSLNRHPAESAIVAVVPVEGGRWMLRNEATGEPVLGDRDFPTQAVAVDALMELARAGGSAATATDLPAVRGIMVFVYMLPGPRADVPDRATGA